KEILDALVAEMLEQKVRLDEALEEFEKQFLQTALAPRGRKFPHPIRIKSSAANAGRCWECSQRATSSRLHQRPTANASSTLPGNPFRCPDPEFTNNIPPATIGPPTSSAPPCPRMPLTVLNSRSVS